MGELKQHPLPMTIDEQIKNLKSLGLIIENEEYAKKILNDISYFRLIKAYSLGFKPKNGKYEEGVTFEQIVELYLFNANFRQVTFAEIEKIEVNVRCRIANYFAEVYGVLGYMEPQNFVDEEYHRAFMADIEEEVRRNSSVLSEAGQFSCEDLRPDQGSGEDQYHRGEKKDFRQRQKALCHEGIEHPGISCHDTGGERGEGCRDSGNLHEQAGTGRVLTD